MNLFPPRMKVRNRIIARNISLWKLRTCLILQLFFFIMAVFAVPTALFGYISIWWFVIIMGMSIIMLVLYMILWHRMIDNMKKSSDRIFLRKMLEQETW